MESKMMKRVSESGGMFRIFARSVYDATNNKPSKNRSNISSPCTSNETSPNSSEKSTDATKNSPPDNSYQDKQGLEENKITAPSKILKKEINRDTESDESVTRCIHTDFEKNGEDKPDVSLREIQINKCEEKVGNEHDKPKMSQIKPHQLVFHNSKTASNQTEATKNSNESRTVPSRRSFSQGHAFSGNHRYDKHFVSKKNHPFSQNNTENHRPDVKNRKKSFEANVKKTNENQSKHGNVPENSEDWSTEFLDISDEEPQNLIEDLNPVNVDSKTNSTTASSSTGVISSIHVPSLTIQNSESQGIISEHSSGKDTIELTIRTKSLSLNCLVESNLNVKEDWSNECNVVETKELPASAPTLLKCEASSLSITKPCVTTTNSNMSIVNSDKTKLIDSANNSISNDVPKCDKLIKNDMQTTSDSIESVVYLQESGGTRLKPILARGGIRPPSGSRGGRGSILRRERSASTSDETKINPHPLMSNKFDGNWEKLLETCEQEKVVEIFDSETSGSTTGSSRNPEYIQPLESQDYRKKQNIRETRSLNEIHSKPLCHPGRPKRFIRNSKEDKVVNTRPDKSLDEELKKLDEQHGFGMPKQTSKHEYNHSEQKTPGIPSHTCNSSEDWTTELLEITSCTAVEVQSDPIPRNSDTVAFENKSTVSNNSDNKRKPQTFAELNIMCTSPGDVSPSDLLKSTSIETTEIIQHCQKIDTSSYMCSNENGSKEIADIVSNPLRKDFITSSKTTFSSTPINDFSDFSSVGSDEDFIYKTSCKEVFKKPEASLESSNQLCQKNKHHKLYSSQEMSTTDNTSGISADFQKCSKPPSNSKTSPLAAGDGSEFHDRCLDADHSHYPYYSGQAPPPPPYDPRMFNPFLQNNWMHFYPYPYICPPYFPCEYGSQLQKLSPQNTEERPSPQHSLFDKVSNATADLKNNVKLNSQDVRVRKEDGKTDIHSHKLYSGEDSEINSKDKDTLYSLFTIPLSQICDLEQAQRLLQYVDSIVNNMPRATGAYYKGSVNQGEHSLIVGATLNNVTSTATNDTTQRKLSEGGLNENNRSFSGGSSPNKPQYQYQPRYPLPPQSIYGPRCSSLQSGRHGFPFPERFDKQSDVHYGNQSSREEQNNYINRTSSNMTGNTEAGSPNHSIVSYDITDEEDIYDEACSSNHKVTTNLKHVSNDQRNVICNKLIDQSLDNRTVQENYEFEYIPYTKTLYNTKPVVKDFRDMNEKRRIGELDGVHRTVREQHRESSDHPKTEQDHVTSNARYIPPHKRRFSEENEMFARPLTKFGQFNVLEQEKENPHEFLQKYMKTSPSSTYDSNSMQNQSQNLMQHNWFQKTGVDVPLVNPSRFDYPRCQGHLDYQDDRNKYRRGNFQQNPIPAAFIKDAKNFSDTGRPHSSNNSQRSDANQSSGSQYSSRLLNDNRLNNDQTAIWKSRFIQRSKRYKVPYIDTHCHLDLLFKKLDFHGSFKSFQEEFKDCFPHNFEGCLAVFCDPRSFSSDGLWKKLTEERNVWIAMGCHPKNARYFNEMAEVNLERIMQHPRVVALGEIGLDYSYGHDNFEAVQKTVFIRQLKMCLETRKPLVIHCRDAEDDCLEIMEKIVPRRYLIQCHCFSGDYTQAQKWLSMFPNLYLGITPLVTYSSASPTHDVARNIPLNRLLLETDAPYFIPRLLHKEQQVSSIPGFALVVAEEVARYQDISVDEVLGYCRQNTQTLFGI